MLLPALLALLMPSPVAVTLSAVAYVRADPDGVGTGFVVDRDKRLLITCRHVIGERKSAEVFFPWVRNGALETDREAYLSHREQLRTLGLLVKGKVLRTSDDLDLALLELDSLPPGTSALPITDDPLSTGERVVGFGNRADLETLWNVSNGLVRQSGKLADGYDWQGTLLAKNAPSMLLQLPVEQGDSGGPVVNARGELVAVVSGLRRQATLAAIGIRADSVRGFLSGRVADSRRVSDPDPLSARADHPTDAIRSVVWLRPTATDTRTAGVVIDAKRRLVLTSATGAGRMDRVGVAFPQVTNGQVVGERDAYRDPVAVQLMKGWHVGTVLHRDASRDLALVQLDSIPADTPDVKLADTDPNLSHAVVAVSHPTGTEFAFAVSTGSVKQQGRFALTRDGRKVPAAVYQLPAQPTSSGGPIFNSAGELVGIQSAKDGPSMVGFAARVGEMRAFVGEALLTATITPVVSLWAEANTFNKFAAWHRLGTGDADTAVSLHTACIPALVQAKQYDRVLELRPQHHDALVGRAEMWVAKNEPKKAAADLQRILDVTPADTAVRTRFASSTAAAGDEARAAAEFANVLKLDLSRKPEVIAAVFAHADALERKAESRAADWLVLALGSLNAVAKDEAITAALKRASAATKPKAKLRELRTLAGPK